MHNFLVIEEKSSVREFLINDLSNAGLRIDSSKHRQIILSQSSPQISNQSKQQQQTQQQGSRVFNVALQKMDMIAIKLDNLDLTVPIFLRWCFDCIRRSIKHEGLFRKSGGSQRVKELMVRIEDGPLTSSLLPSNTVFDICSVFKEFLRRLPCPLISYPIQDLLLDCFSMRSIVTEKKIDIYLNILLLLPDEHLHSLIYVLRFLNEISLHERENKMNAKNLAICVGPGIMRTPIEGKSSLMTEQCATSVSDIVETLILNATKLGFVCESVYERSQMLMEMRQKDVIHQADESFALENGLENGGNAQKFNDPANSKKRRSGSVKEFLVHMTNRLRRRSGSNNDSRDQTNVFLDQTGKLSSSHTREYRYNYQQNSVTGHCLSSSSTSATTTKRKSSDDPNGMNSKRGKTKTSTQEKSSLPDTNRFTSPITAFRRKKKTPASSNDPEHSHLPQLLHFTDEVPLRFSNAVVSQVPIGSSSSSSSAAITPSSSMTGLASSIGNNASILLGSHPSSDHSAALLSNPAAPSASINKSLDAKKLNLLDSWKWPKSSRRLLLISLNELKKAERKPLVAIHGAMLTGSAIGCSSLTQSPPSPIKSNHASNSAQQTSLLMHSSFGVPRRHSDDVVNTSLTTTAYRPRRSISSSAGQQQTRHVMCMLNNHSHSLPSNQEPAVSDDEEHEQVKTHIPSMTNDLNISQQSFDDEEEDEEDLPNELNLAVVVGNEDLQSLRAFPVEQNNPEPESLDVAFIDELDVDRQKMTNIEDMTNAMDVQMSNSQQDNETIAQITANNVEQQSIEMNEIESKPNDLDEILRQNENRCVRLTDSDDDETVSLKVHQNRPSTPTKTPNKIDQEKSTTPKMPVRLSSSISNLISTSSLSSIIKERSLSCSLSQPSADMFQSKAGLHETNEKHPALLNGGRESILQLKEELAGRVSRQIRAFEQRSTENIQNRSVVLSLNSSLNTIGCSNFVKEKLDEATNSTTFPKFPIIKTNDEKIFQRTIDRFSSAGQSLTGEVTRSVKRLQNTPIRRWRERAKETERRHQLTPPHRLLARKRRL